MQRKALPYSTLHFPICESTHIWALQNIPLLVAKHGLSQTRPVRISTDFQTKGIGQPIRSRSTTQSDGSSTTSNEYKTWMSSPGNVSVTYVFPWPQKKMDGVTQLPQVASIAVVNTLKQLGLIPQVKWVNDILVNQKKIGGILCNSTGFQLQDENIGTDGEAFTAVLVSIGLNVSSIPSLDHLDKDEQQSVTCVANELGIQLPTAEINNLPGSMNQCSTSSSLLETSPPTAQSPSSSPIHSNTITPSSVLDLLSHELYQMMSLYESRGFNPIYLALTPILFGQNHIVTIRNPSISPSSIQSTLQFSQSIHPTATQPDKVQGIYLGLSPTTGHLLLELTDANNEKNVIEIFGGHLVV